MKYEVEYIKLGSYWGYDEYSYIDEKGEKIVYWKTYRPEFVTVILEG